MTGLLMVIHLLSAVLWIGGVFYAYVILRPSVGFLSGPERISLWDRVFTRFFRWVWVLIAALLISGYGMLFSSFGGFGSPGYLHGMQLFGWLTIITFAVLAFGPYRQLHLAVAAEDWSRGGEMIPRIRRLVHIIMWLGLVSIAIGGGGAFL
ncbi:CopD family protein [Guyparkeria halophila]|uniref:CopD family protein n=1 Tax=Guyparkeria halophila TaxID=47960 RepID=A0ABZ0YVL3_9GAMM|nr:CopD family protein [Guyparkeria halophila]WQH15624.1 CopD family protein [Guyparkeria halophila]